MRLLQQLETLQEALWRHASFRTRASSPISDAVWEEVCQWLTVQPERTGRSVFDELQHRYPGQFATNQLRTLQRHIQLWRATTVLAFDADWMDAESLLQPTLPRPLRVAVGDPGEAEAEECLV